jgi:hypothetical protein
LPLAVALAVEEKTRGEEQNHATVLDVVGTRLGMVQSLVGDSTPEITPEIYLHAVPKEQRRAAESVSSRMRLERKR